jgi:hypothetical protein
VVSRARLQGSSNAGILANADRLTAALSDHGYVDRLAGNAQYNAKPDAAYVATAANLSWVAGDDMI